MNADTSNPYQAPNLPDDATDASLQSSLAEVDYASLKWTASGLSIMYWGIILLVGWLFLIPLRSVFRNGFEFMNYGTDSWLSVMQLINLFMALTPAAMIHFGPVLCLGSPAGTGLRPLAGITVVLMALQWIATLSALTGVVAGRLLIFAGYLLMPLICAVFLAFLFRLAKLLKRDDLARRCRNVFLLGLLLCGLFVGVSMFRPSFANWDLLGTLIAVAYFLLFVCVFVAYANVINAVRRGISNPNDSKRFVGLM